MHPVVGTAPEPKATAADLRSCASGLAAVLMAAMALPMLVLYAVGTLGPMLGRDLGVAPGSLGWVTAATFGVAAALSPWAGTWTARLGGRLGLVVLFLAVSLVYTMMAWAPGLTALTCAVAVGGVAQALCNPVTNLLIAQQVAPNQRPRMVGVKQAGVQVAALFAGLALPVLASRWGWRWTLGLMAPLGLLLALAVPAVTRQHAAGPVPPMTPPRPNLALAVLMGIQWCVGAALSAFIVSLPAHAAAQGWPLVQAGHLVAVFAATGLVSRVVLTPLAAQLRDESWLILFLLVIAAASAGGVLLAGPLRQWPLWCAAGLMGISAVALNAVAMGMVVRHATFGATAVASGWLSAAFFAGLALGAPLAAAAANFGYGLEWTWLGLAMVLSVAATITPLLRWAMRGSRVSRG
ncbi:MFS transporter [Acidovorax sp. SUPP3334]|uniref:MFS transporter n=1 Tax=Acidovorax sp. SUPP3334 TaxID=2920881 RepID=UPI0023DE4E82|nr:MFS transporter [Acidovorax sp. SUPP3334]GKT24907.1 MFS transporter [Acidovorax sp. SUPP3334]